MASQSLFDSLSNNTRKPTKEGKGKMKKIIASLVSLVLMFGMVRTALGYSFTDAQDVNDGTVGQLVVSVAEDGDWMVWTFDFPVEQFTGNGNLNVGLIIATEGEGEGPAFQIHNNDGATLVEPHGTWMYGYWGPTIGDGWFGWPNHDLDVSLTGLDWVEAIGQRNTPWEGLESGDGVMEIRIKKSVLGESFHWAASPTVGTGFWAPAYDVTMQIPAGFGWATPIVDMGVPNYVYVPPPPAPGAGKAPFYDSIPYTCPGGAGTSGPTYGFVVLNTNRRGDLIVQVSLKGATPNATYDIWVNQDPGACPLPLPPTAPDALTTNKRGNGNAHVKVARVDGADNFWVSAVGGGQVLRSTAVQLD